MTAIQTYHAFTGGLDQESAAIAVPVGRSIAVLNHESVSRGYQRTQGYERYDGQPRPSDETFYRIEFTNGTVEFAEGDEILGYASGATARVLVVPPLESGAWDGTGTGTLILHRISETVFTVGEALRVGGVTYAVLGTLPVEGDGYEDEESAAYLLQAVEYARALIQPVPGTGPVRGVIWFENKLHAWRDNGGNGVLNHSSPAGWDPPDIGSIVQYSSGGTYEIVAGDVITGAVSGATATVRTIVTNVETEWADGDAEGTMVLDDIVGTFEAEEVSVGANEFVASIAEAPAPAVFPPGGRYELEIFNFYGAVGTERVYGANGVGQAFEYDGDAIIPIDTGMEDDTPFLVREHKSHLFLGFRKGSLQHSDLGEPRSFTARLGAAELGMGHELTNLIANTEATMLVTTDSSVAMMTGSDSSDWLLEGLDDKSGGKAWSAQRVGQVIYLDERGVRAVTSAGFYANFRLGTYTSLIQKELDDKRRRGATPCASCVLKTKDQYLLFFDDMTGISIFFGRKVPEPMMFTYPFEAHCIHVAEVDGVERCWVGATDGYVYELNVGTSFDGAEIEAYIQMPFGHEGAPRTLKRYHKAVIELVAGPGTELQVVSQFDYGVGLQPYSGEQDFGIVGGGGLWGISNWATFYWDSPTVAQAEVYLQGMGANMSLIIFSLSKTMRSYILQGVTNLFSPRGVKR